MNKSQYSGQDNFLDLVPEKSCRWEPNGDGGVYLLVPRFRNRWFKKLALKLGKTEFVNVKLDALGSRVWNLVDGAGSVAQIGKSLGPEADENEEQMYQRLSEFLSMLARNKFVSLKGAAPVK